MGAVKKRKKLASDDTIHGVKQAIMRAITLNNLKYSHVNTSTQVPGCCVVSGVDSFAIWGINDPSLQ